MPTELLGNLITLFANCILIDFTDLLVAVLSKDESTTNQPRSGTTKALAGSACDLPYAAIRDGYIWISEISVIEYVGEAALEFEASLSEEWDVLEQGGVERVHIRAHDHAKDPLPKVPF